MTRSMRVVAVVSVLGMLAAGCGKAGSTKSSATTTGSTVAASVAPSKKFSLATPVKIVALVSDPGKDPYAVADYNDGARMAVDEINKAGGLGGHPVEFKAITTAPYGDVTAAFNQALAEKPTVLLGPVSSSPLLSIAAKIDKAGIPTLQQATERQAAKDGTSGSQWIFGMRPWNTAESKVAAKFTSDELKAKKVGVMYLDAAFGQEGNTAIKDELTSAGVTVAPDVSFGATDTDFTPQVQAMKGTDAVIDWGTPQSLASSVVSFAQQGLADTPHVGPGSIGFSSFYTGIKDPSLLKNVYGVLDCNPAGDARPVVKDWAGRFQSAYKFAPSYASAQMYDSVYIVRKVIEEAGKSDPASIRDGLNTLKYTSGICTDDYENHDNVLINSAVVVGFENGKPVTKKSYADLQNLK